MKKYSSLILLIVICLYCCFIYSKIGILNIQEATILLIAFVANIPLLKDVYKTSMEDWMNRLIEVDLMSNTLKNISENGSAFDLSNTINVCVESLRKMKYPIIDCENREWEIDGLAYYETEDEVRFKCKDRFANKRMEDF